MSRFEDHLWREFVHEHGDELANLTGSAGGHRLRRRQLIVGGAMGLAGGATALVLALSATSAPPAFAVTRNHNGTVTVTIRSPSGIAGANAELHRLGIRAKVELTGPAGCQPVQIVAPPSGQSPAGNQVWRCTLPSPSVVLPSSPGAVSNQVVR